MPTTTPTLQPCTQSAGQANGQGYSRTTQVIHKRSGNVLGQYNFILDGVDNPANSRQGYSRKIVTETLAQPSAPNITSTINYAYDPLYRLTGANYTGSLTYTFAYRYDAVGNRTAQTSTITSTLVTTYTYDAANRLSAVSGQPYTWDANGNLTSDGSAAYLYDSANPVKSGQGHGRLISTTLGGVSTQFNYNGDGVRLRQVAAGTPTTYTQDLAAPLPVVLQSRTGATTTSYEFSNGTRPIGQFNAGGSGTWGYLLPDALGSVRQIAALNGSLTLAKTYDPYGSVVKTNGSGTSIFGFSGEQTDASGLTYLRARYMQPKLGIFLSHDPVSGDAMRPGSMNGFNYASGNPNNRTDPSGRISESEKWYIHYLYDNYIQDVVSRLHDPVLTNLSDAAFASMIAAKFLVEDATPYADQQPEGRNRYLKDLLMGSVPGSVAIAIQNIQHQTYSWGPANIPAPLAELYLNWWEQNHANLPSGCFLLQNAETEYYVFRDNFLLLFLLQQEDITGPYEQVAQELRTDKGAVQGTALAILESSDRARKYWGSIGQPSHELSAYTIALGVNAYNEHDETLYLLSNWTSKGSAWDWVEAIDDAAQELGLTLGSFLPYTDEEKARLAPLPNR